MGMYKAESIGAGMYKAEITWEGMRKAEGIGAGMYKAEITWEGMYKAAKLGQVCPSSAKLVSQDQAARQLCQVLKWSLCM